MQKKMNNDITIIFLTPNRVPKQWAEYHKKILLEAIGDTPIITISKDPLDWGLNILQTEYSVSNIYRQILRGAKMATTPYVAVAEDDTLYSKEHFQYRPPLDKFAYDLNRWVIFTWGEAFYFHKPRPANSGMIAPRELLIKAFEEKFRKYPNGIPEGMAKEVGTHNDGWGYEEFYSSQPYVGFNHDFSVDDLERRHHKKAGMVRAYDIPIWGRAEELRKHFI